jgi:hypothetical protein
VSTSESPRRWTGIKKRLGFCRLTQDGDDEGCLYLDRLPKADEAVLIREAIGIRKRRHLTPEALVALERARAAIKTPFRGDSVRQNEVPATTQRGVMEGAIRLLPHSDARHPASESKPEPRLRRGTSDWARRRAGGSCDEDSDRGVRKFSQAQTVLALTNAI